MVGHREKLASVDMLNLDTAAGRTHPPKVFSRGQDHPPNHLRLHSNVVIDIAGHLLAALGQGSYNCVGVQQKSTRTSASTPTKDFCLRASVVEFFADKPGQVYAGILSHNSWGIRLVNILSFSIVGNLPQL